MVPTQNLQLSSGVLQGDNLSADCKMFAESLLFYTLYVEYLFLTQAPLNFLAKYWLGFFLPPTILIKKQYDEHYRILFE
uniref:Uncharacterized protein n=1 Tax=Acrobeloides nanus TaxID=290746 RepID=A0A914BV73_9BILA